MARKPATDLVEGKSISPPEAFVPMSEFRKLADRLETLELATASFGVSLIGGGKLLARCDCGDFVVRVARFEHKLAGTVFRPKCDLCTFNDHPLFEQGTVSYEPIERMTEEELARALRVNAARRELRKSLGSPVKLAGVREWS